MQQASLFPAQEPFGKAAGRRRRRPGGVRSLTDVELVSVLLRSGGSEAAALEAAREVLGGGGLGDLLRWNETSLVIRRLGPPAASVLAAAELGRRLARLRLPPRRLMDRPDLVASYLWMRYHTYDQEVAGALYLDVHGHLITDREVARGTLTKALLEPRIFLRPALEYGAATMILFHTHPSGSPSPSAEDLAFTRRLRAAGKVVGVELLDHLILGSRCRYVSLRHRETF